MSDNQLRIKDFIEKEWVEYAAYDNDRSLPHIMDGLKVTQRKAIYTATKLPKDSKPIRVSQFAAKASELTAYHHGESSMVKAVVGLAQDYPGKNNFPLLEKHGQFGTRLSADAGGPRYITTRLHENFHKLFLPEDQKIVNHLYEDGDQIEPSFFIPIVPTLLLNGCDAVGTGYKSVMLNYNIKDVCRAIKEIGKYGYVKTPLVPYLNGWTGEITKEDRQVTFTGKIQVVNSRKMIISELPPSYDREKYKKVLNEIIETKEGVKDYENNSTEAKWEWVIHCTKELSEKPMEELIEFFKLRSKVTENLVCWDSGDEPLTFDTVEKLIEHWYNARIKLYEKSLQNQIKELQTDIIENTLKMRFISWCWKNEIKNLSKAEFVDKVTSEIKSMKREYAEKFVSIPIFRLTKEESDKLQNQIDEMVDRLEYLEGLTAVDLMQKNINDLKL